MKEGCVRCTLTSRCGRFPVCHGRKSHNKPGGHHGHFFCSLEQEPSAHAREDSRLPLAKEGGGDFILANSLPQGKQRRAEEGVCRAINRTYYSAARQSAFYQLRLVKRSRRNSCHVKHGRNFSPFFQIIIN